MKLSKICSFLLPLAFVGTIANAQNVPDALKGDAALRNTFYIGAGRADDGSDIENDDTPFSIGFMHQKADSKMIIGFDLGREGTMLDSTWRKDASPEQATSYNLLLGGNLVDTGHFRADLALLAGFREAVSDCPDSHLGYQCYAATAPDIEYKGNFGAVLTLSVDRVVIGLRATGESTQVVAGLRF